jgi:hypothetical protein
MQKISTLLVTAFILFFASCKKTDVSTPAPVVTPTPPAPPAVIYDSIFIANTIAGGNKQYAYYQVRTNSTATNSSSTSGGFGKGCISLDNKYRYQHAVNNSGAQFIHKLNYGVSTSLGYFNVIPPTNSGLFQVWEMASISGTNRLALKCNVSYVNPYTTNTDDIYTCNDDGTGIAKITNYGITGSSVQTYINYLAVNKSGAKLVYNKGTSNLNRTDLMTINVDGSNEKTILTGTIGLYDRFISPCFSKDDTKIYYANSNNEVRSVNSNGTGDVLLFTTVGLPIKKLSLNKAGNAFFIAQSSTTDYTVKQVDLNGLNPILIRDAGVAFVDFLVQN